MPILKEDEGKIYGKYNEANAWRLVRRWTW